jgi:hypothetical protein
MLECASFGDETAVNKGKKHKCWQAPLKMPEFTLAARNDRQCMFVVWLFFSLMEESTKPISFSPESLSQYQPWTRADAVRPRVSAANHIPPQECAFR